MHRTPPVADPSENAAPVADIPTPAGPETVYGGAANDARGRDAAIDLIRSMYAVPSNDGGTWVTLANEAVIFEFAADGTLDNVTFEWAELRDHLNAMRKRRTSLATPAGTPRGGPGQ